MRPSARESFETVDGTRSWLVHRVTQRPVDRTSMRETPGSVVAPPLTEAGPPWALLFSTRGGGPGANWGFSVAPIPGAKTGSPHRRPGAGGRGARQETN